MLFMAAAMAAVDYIWEKIDETQADLGNYVDNSTGKNMAYL
jgi:hypothetical protein